MSAPRTSTSLLSLWPEILTSIAVVLSVTWIAGRVVQYAGDFSYCLDDAYIHLAIAKNLVEHHVWGVTQYEFSSASSSPLWVLLLAAFAAVTGADLYLPLALNLLLAPAALFVAAAVLRQRGVPQPVIALLLVGIAFLSALPTLIMSGMEHSLQILFVFSWVYLIDDAFRADPPLPARRVVWLSVLAGAMTLCRYESLFLVFVTCALLFFRRDRIAAVVIGVSAWIPISIFGAVSVAKGWHWLPNSVLVKSMTVRDWSTPEHAFDALVGRSISQLITNNHMVPLLGTALVGIWWLGRRGVPLLRSPRALLICYAGMTWLHLQLASFGWFYRYEAYLIATGILVLGVAMVPVGESAVVPAPRWAIAAAALLLAVPLAIRGEAAFVLTPFAGKNIHDQQMQVGRFLGAEMGDAAVALNDIGGPSLFSKVHVVDYYGLGTLDTANWRMTSGGYTPQEIEKIARRHHVELAIIHTWVLGAAIPHSWRYIASWKAPDPNIGLLGDQTVSFYAVDRTEEETQALVHKIIEFSKVLPAGTRIGISKEFVQQPEVGKAG